MPITEDVVVPPDLRDWVADRITKRQFELPLLPEVATQVMDLTARADTDAAELSDVLHRDQAFAGHVLRVANSPAMGSSVQIVSLQQAVSRLGMARVAEIAMAISVLGKLFGDKRNGDLMRALWRHALATGSYAKEIARKRRDNVESAFLCGLLHSVGKPIVLDIIDEWGATQGEPSTTVVHSLLAEYHIQLGVVLCEEWQLPPHVTEAVRFHEEYRAAPNHGSIAMLVNLATWLAHYVAPSSTEVTEDQLRELDVVVELNLYPEDMDELFARGDAVRQLVEATV